MVEKRRKEFMLAMTIFALACFLRFFQRTMEYQNTTLFALNYSYGFISRGLLGTIYASLNKLLPINMMTYEAVYTFNIIATLVYFLTALLFCNYCIKKREAEFDRLKYLIIVFGIYTFSMYLSEENFGRLDLYLTILTFIAMWLILEKKCLFLVPVLAGICTMIHQGYVFTHVNLILVLLLYLALNSQDKKEKRKLYIVFILTFLIVSAFFLYFEFGSHENGQSIYNAVVSDAKGLSESGEDYNEAIIKHEILGEDVFEDEWEYHLNNYRELPFYILIYLPFIILGVAFLKNLFRKAGAKGSEADGNGNKKRKLAYLFLILGPLTLLPQMILKVDYGRYMYLISSYVIELLMCMYVLGDHYVMETVSQLGHKIREKLPIPEVLLIYLLFIMPHLDVLISWTSYRLSALIFRL